MISPQQAGTIKQILGDGYAKKVVKHLAKNRLKRPSGKNYSTQDVYNVMTGYRENPELENAIFDLVGEVRRKEKEEALRRQAILK